MQLQKTTRQKRWRAFAKLVLSHALLLVVKKLMRILRAQHQHPMIDVLPSQGANVYDIIASRYICLTKKLWQTYRKIERISTDGSAKKKEKGRNRRMDV